MELKVLARILPNYPDNTYWNVVEYNCPAIHVFQPRNPYFVTLGYPENWRLHIAGLLRHRVWQKLDWGRKPWMELVESFPWLLTFSSEQRIDNKTVFKRRRNYSPVAISRQCPTYSCLKFRAGSQCCPQERLPEDPPAWQIFHRLCRDLADASRGSILTWAGRAKAGRLGTGLEPPQDNVCTLAPRQAPADPMGYSDLLGHYIAGADPSSPHSPKKACVSPTDIFDFFHICFPSTVFKCTLFLQCTISSNLHTISFVGVRKKLSQGNTSCSQLQVSLVAVMKQIKEFRKRRRQKLYQLESIANPSPTSPSCFHKRSYGRTTFVCLGLPRVVWTHKAFHMLMHVWDHCMKT